MYSKRIWLNADTSASTGSAVAFHGETIFRSGVPEVATFLEIADCNAKVQLHKSRADGMEDFICKLRKLADLANEFADHLEGQMADD